MAPSYTEDPLPKLLDEGLYVTLNSDDPPMFNTSLTHAYLDAARTFRLSTGDLERLAMNGGDAALLPDVERSAMRAECEAEFRRLRSEHGV
jgi:adenosine deaminase